MTAYGRASLTSPEGRFVAEIQSVNRKFLEINITLPKPFLRFEIEIRKWLAEAIGRGQVNLYLTWRVEDQDQIRITPNKALAKALKDAWEQIAETLGIPAEEKIDLHLLSREKDLLFFEEELQNEEAYLKALKKVIYKALEPLIAMKEAEGQRLAQDMEKRLALLKKSIDAIEVNAPSMAEVQRKKLTERIEGLFGQSPEMEERIIKEIAFFAERVDITEEIVRFNSHLKQFSHFLHKPLQNASDTRGKTFDFLLQELLREANTIGSKATDADIVHEVIAMKSELEKIREQVQNVE